MDRLEKLSKLSREEKLRLLDLYGEKKRRLKKGGLAYKPNSGQLQIHQSDKRERYVFSGNSFGKTTCLVNEIVWAATGYNPITDTYTKVPAKIICVIDDPDKIGLKIIPEMQKWSSIQDEWLQKVGKPYYSEIRFPNGSFVKFITWGMEAMKAESIELDYLFCDEPLPKYLYTALTRGMREKGSKKKTLVVGTPLTAPWLRIEIFEPWSKGELDYVECFTFDSELNKENLDWEEQERFFAKLSPEERRIRKEGGFFDLSGLALAHLFKRNQHVIEAFPWPRNWPCVVAIDPAGSKPNVASMLGVDQHGQLYYIKELSLKIAPRDFARKLKEWYKDYPVIDIVCDSLGSGETTGGDGLTSFIDVLRDEGVRARPTTYYEKEDERWINLIKEFLYIDPDKEGARPRLEIFYGNNGIVTDIENVQWVKYKNQDIFKPKLDITKKDYLATLKYALATNLSYNKRRAPTHTSGPVGWRDRSIYRG